MSLLNSSSSHIQKQQRRLWYALERLTGKVMAYGFGRRTYATLKKLLSVMKGFDVNLWFTDG